MSRLMSKVRDAQNRGEYYNRSRYYPPKESGMCSRHPGYHVTFKDLEVFIKTAEKMQKIKI